MRKYTVTQTETTPNGRQITTLIKTDDEEIIKLILEGKPLKNNDTMDAEFREVKKPGKKSKTIPDTPQLISTKAKAKKKKK